MSKLFKLVFTVLVLLVLVACPGPGPTPKKADLVPIPDPRPGFKFCQLTDGKLVVKVKNIGEGVASASTVKVEFLPGGVKTLNVGALAAGVQTSLTPIAFPVGCHNPDCNFKITIDINNDVDETQENNNIAEGICIG